MIKFITVWYLIVMPYNHVHSGETAPVIQVPYATQAICERQALNFRDVSVFNDKEPKIKLMNNEPTVAFCQFGQVPVYVGR